MGKDVVRDFRRVVAMETALGLCHSVDIQGFMHTLDVVVIACARF